MPWMAAARSTPNHADREDAHMSAGPITKNGIHPITHQGRKVEAVGVAGTEKPSTPKPAQLEAKKENAAPITAPKSAAEVFYPSAPTLQGK